MTAVLLALVSSLAYGCADFAGGLAARRASLLRVGAVAGPASLAGVVVLLPVLGAGFDAATLAWGAASGVAAAATFVLLYRCLALGPMSVLSPLTAAVSAALPVAVGLFLGERLTALGVAGIVAALLAVVLVSAAPAEAPTRPSRAALGTGLAAGLAIAVQFVCLDSAPDDSGAAPLLVGRTVAALLLLTALLLAPRAARGARLAGGAAALAAFAGLLDALANAAFLVAARLGDLAVVAVVVALYPAATVLLARGVLGERLRGAQLAGLAVALAAVVLLALP
ncbi:EamA-like transporter family protein [Kineococcus xinjiangensis]|uniref:EamA-like transporter family protein n=1 Tax=Kineococcus xinjiangensis TaxID=512762 RepID=A0A2S6IWG1_9ACTN|nr:EamA family transporter [Kineococcus xinjiangensis]PPK98694.1 EamA-like transporter family protein [Kineococcus xinjiangensis]